MLPPYSGGMEHGSPLIAVLVIGIGLAFVLGTIAHRFKLPPLVGYVLAGVMVGPTMLPGLSIDQHLTLQFADVGAVEPKHGEVVHIELEQVVQRLGPRGADLFEGDFRHVGLLIVVGRSFDPIRRG